MNFVDFIIIFIIIIGVIIGYKGGFFKTAIDIFTLYTAMIIAGLLKGVLGNTLSMFLPFISFNGLYSLNIIMYQLVAYVLILLLILGIYQFIMKKTKLDDKVSDKALTAPLYSKIIGAVLGIPLALIFTYNLLLIAKFPVMNLTAVRDSYFSRKMMESNMPISRINMVLYDSSEYATDVISEYNGEKSAYTDTIIVDYFNATSLISYEKTDELRAKGSLPEYTDDSGVNVTDTDGDAEEE